MTESLYDVLAVKKTASKEEIKRSYRNKAKSAHPDAGGDAEQFKKLNLAYLVLSDDERRAKYDYTGEHKSKDRLGKILDALGGSLAAVLRG